jgi:flagellar protein FliS
MNSTAGSYKKVQVETTDAMKLVVMLYEGGINFLEQAKLRVADNQVAEKGILIDKVIAIISELQSSLNMAQGGEVARGLDRVYGYMINRLLEANINNDPQMIDEVVKHLRTLIRAWKKVAEQGMEATATTSAKPTMPQIAPTAPLRSQVAAPLVSRTVIELVG